MTYLNNKRNNFNRGKSMYKPTDNLHDYTNMLFFMASIIQSGTIAATDADFSDMKGTVIKSFPDQVLQRMLEEKFELEEEEEL